MKFIEYKGHSRLRYAANPGEFISITTSGYVYFSVKFVEIHKLKPGYLKLAYSEENPKIIALTFTEKEGHKLSRNKCAGWTVRLHQFFKAIDYKTDSTKLYRYKKDRNSFIIDLENDWVDRNIL